MEIKYLLNSNTKINHMNHTMKKKQLVFNEHLYLVATKLFFLRLLWFRLQIRSLFCSIAIDAFNFQLNQNKTGDVFNWNLFVIEFVWFDVCLKHSFNFDTTKQESHTKCTHFKNLSISFSLLITFKKHTNDCSCSLF